MKKAFLFRMLAIVIFCLASIAIKSETTACKLSNHCTAKTTDAAVPVKLVSEENEYNFYRPDILLIKI